MNSLIKGSKLDMLMMLLEGQRHVEGAIAEFGVYQGGTLRTMAEFCPDRLCYGFDTFTGLPDSMRNVNDVLPSGKFADINLHRLHFDMPDNVKLIVGVFPESTDDGSAEDRFAFAHVDFDYQRSTTAAIDWLMPRMVAKGMIVFDDYQFAECPGVEAAIVSRGLHVMPTTINQCVWIAP